MEPLSGVTSAASLSGPIAIHGSACLLRARDVTVVFKERRYDTDAHKTWCFAHIDHVAIVTGRLQLLREGYGVVFDVPSDEVEQVYTIDQDRSLPRIRASPLRPDDAGLERDAPHLEEHASGRSRTRDLEHAVRHGRWT